MPEHSALEEYFIKYFEGIANENISLRAEVARYKAKDLASGLPTTVSSTGTPCLAMFYGCWENIYNSRLDSIEKFQRFCDAIEARDFKTLEDIYSIKVRSTAINYIIPICGIAVYLSVSVYDADVTVSQVRRKDYPFDSPEDAQNAVIDSACKKREEFKTTDAYKKMYESVTLASKPETFGLDHSGIYRPNPDILVSGDSLSPLRPSLSTDPTGQFVQNPDGTTTFKKK